MDNTDYKSEDIDLYKLIHSRYDSYTQKEHVESIYFYSDEDEEKEYADIRINKKSKIFYYQWGLFYEFYDKFSLNHKVFEDYSLKWIEDRFNLKGLIPVCVPGVMREQIKIPT